MIGCVVVEFDDLRAIRQDNPIRRAAVEIHQRCVTPIIGRMRNEFEPIRVGHECAVNADNTEKNLVAGGGFVAYLKLPVLASVCDDKRNLRRFKTVFHVGVMVFTKFTGTDAGDGREFLECRSNASTAAGCAG